MFSQQGFRRQRKGQEIFEEIIVENFTNMRKKIFTQVQELWRISQAKDKPEKKHVNTHNKQIDKN